MAGESDPIDSRPDHRIFRPETSPRKIGTGRFADFVASFLDFAKWGFQQSYASPDQKTLVYDSPSCRLLFSLRIEREADEISVHYGRRHAPSEGFIIEWEGQRCIAWHNIRTLHVPEFFDGLTARQVVGQELAQIEIPAMVEFTHSQLGKELRAPASGVAYHQFLWERYGAKLFNLFDIRHADVWEKFRQFVRDYYALRNAESEAIFEVPHWRIC